MGVTDSGSPVTRLRARLGATGFFRRKWFLTVAAAGVAAGLVAVMVVWVRSGSSPPPASDVLDKARRFVGGASSVEFGATVRGEAGAATPWGVQSVTFEGAAAFPDRGRVIQSQPGQAAESTYIADRVYTRVATSRADLRNQAFSLSPIEFVTNGKPVGGDSGVLFVRPQDLSLVPAAMRHTVVTAHSDGRTTIEARVDAARFAIPNVDRATIALTVRDEGRIERLRLTTRSSDATSSLTMVFKHWNRAVSIEIPAAGDVDLAHGYIDEQGIAAYQAATLYQPHAIPRGWTLVAAAVVPPVPGNTFCDTVQLDFASGDQSGFLELYEVPASCAQGVPPGAEPLQAGAYRGWIGTDPVNGANGARLYVGDTTIVSYTSLTRSELTALLSAVDPLDLKKPPSETLSPDNAA